MPPKSKGSAPLATAVQGDFSFTHPTGDRYEGSFEMRRKEKALFMNGPGTYTTAEGDMYRAIWHYDNIVADAPTEIEFADKSKFIGTLKNWCYTGSGLYVFPDDATLACTFLNNCPVEDLILTDPNGREWKGKAEKGYAWFNPGNHFFDRLPSELEVKKKRRKILKKPDSAQISKSIL